MKAANRSKKRSAAKHSSNETGMPLATKHEPRTLPATVSKTVSLPANAHERKTPLTGEREIDRLTAKHAVTHRESVTVKRRRSAIDGMLPPRLKPSKTKSDSVVLMLSTSR